MWSSSTQRTTRRSARTFPTRARIFGCLRQTAATALQSCLFGWDRDPANRSFTCIWMSSSGATTSKKPSADPSRRHRRCPWTCRKKTRRYSTLSSLSSTRELLSLFGLSHPCYRQKQRTARAGILTGITTIRTRTGQRRLTRAPGARPALRAAAVCRSEGRDAPGNELSKRDPDRIAQGVGVHAA